MKNKILHTATVLLGALVILMVISVARGQEQKPKDPPVERADFVKRYCFDGDIDQMDISDLADKYTEETNNYFNDRIKQIMTKPDESVPTPDLNDYPTLGGALCRNKDGKEANDMTCQSIAVCNPVNAPASSNPQNHPYCLAVTLLGVPPSKIANYNYSRLEAIKPLRYSYFCYQAALNMKRDALYDSTPQGIKAKCESKPPSPYAKSDICKILGQIKTEQDPAKLASLQEQLNKEMDQKQWWSTSGRGALTSMTGTLVDFSEKTAQRIKYIDEEITRAKTALDQTLDAYSQLKTAWQMHVRYMDIFAELVQYRDHLVTIRKQTDAFPFRFIDATSTKCL
jgi:hypothetical protein